MSNSGEAVRKILQFRQETTSSPIRYAISAMGISDEVIGTADAADANRPKLTMDGKTLQLDLTAAGDGAQETAQILDADGAAIGNIIPWTRMSKSILARSEDYDYRVMTVDGEVRLFIYEVGFGENGHFWCIYEDDDALVAMIQKASVTKDSKDVYELYFEREELAVWTSLLALYIDATAYARVNENGFNRENLVTTAKALLRKYDANFIQRIRSQLDEFRGNKPAY